MKPDFKIYNSIFSIAKNIICVLLGIFISFSCTRDMEEPYTNTLQEEERVINLRIWFPSNPAGPESRSITDIEENYISSLYILSFSMNGNAEKFDYWTKGLEKDGNTNGSAVQDYSAVLKVRNHNQRLVLLANIGEDVKQQIEQGNWKDVKKEVMLASLDENVGNPENRWNADSPLDYHSLPMWGESIPETIMNTTFNLTATIPLLRMVAKIDVQVDESITGLTDKFRLRSVRLYNTNTKGKLVPAKENIEDITVNGSRTVSVKTPTIPGDIADYSKRHLGPVVYEDFSSPGKEEIAIRNAIYLFEVASPTAPPEATCLVIGGYYGTEMEETYYRVDFIADDGVTLRDILRNHRYIVNITNVKQSGHTDPDDAFNSKGGNVEVSIVAWDEGGMNHVAFDGQNILSISQDIFHFSREGRNLPETDNVLNIYTDWISFSAEARSGWYVEKIVDAADNSRIAEWVRLSPDKGGANNKVEAVLYLDENNSGSDRSAVIWIAAGRLRMAVTVNQTVSYRFDIRIMDPVTGEEINELNFISASGSTPTAQSFVVKWEPASLDVTILNESMNSTGFDPASGIPVESVIPGGGNGEKTYIIQPSAITNDGNETRVTKLDFIISDGNIFQSATIFLKQRAFVFEANPAKAYLMDGLISSFRIKSNFEWAATLVQNENNAVAELITYRGGSNETIEEEISFRTTDYLSPPYCGLSTAAIRITSLNGEYPEQIVPLALVSAEKRTTSNSYILTAGTPYGILIPVSRANESELRVQIADGDTFVSELMWTDNPLGVDEDSNIALIQHFYEGPGGYLFILPGKAQGNGVVAIRCNGEIIWSWHLWVCNENNHPLTINGYMDRNLGAFATEWTGTPTTNSMGDPVIGLYYQWGRKDPFPTTLNVAYGNPIIEEPFSSFLYAYRNSVRNPVAYILSMSTHNRNSRPKAWDNGSANYKTADDPCPEGYRVPRPAQLSHVDSDWITTGTVGINRDGYGGFYPATGSRRVEKISLGKNVSLWTSTKYPNVPGEGDGRWEFLFYQSNSFPSPDIPHGSSFHHFKWGGNMIHASTAINVRCVVDQ